MTPTPTKNESLPELVDKWRARADGISVSGTWSGDFVAGFIRDCADDLQAALTREAPTEGVGGDAAALIDQVNRIESAIEDASRQYHDSTRWAEEPSVYDDRSSQSLQDVIDQGFNKLREMLAATPPAPQRLAQGEDFENLCIAVQICRELSWNAVTSEKPGSLTDTIARLVAYVERRKS